MSLLSFFKSYKYFAIAFGALCLVIIAVFYNILNVNQPLPIYQPAMVNEELVDESVKFKRKYHTISDFSLINQNGDTITQADYENKIYVADFFFTTCQTICPIMTDHMYQIQQEILDDDDVMLLSHSVTPDID
ncbi:MAG: SCO family protein, partial [Winogradskyella sp.]|nr:SCO family protein [Winogradskyella sp.]